MKHFWLLVLLAGTTLLPGAETLPPPNILWLTCEDNNVDWVGCYGNPNANTPNIGGRNDKDCWDHSGKVKWDTLKKKQPFFQIINSTASHESKAFGDVNNTTPPGPPCANTIPTSRTCERTMPTITTP